MVRRRLVWQLYPSFLLVAVLAMVSTGWYASVRVRQFHIKHLAANLEIRARLLQSEVAPGGTLAAPEAINAACNKFGRLTRTRLTVIRVDGTVLGDSDHDPLTMESHAPEAVLKLPDGNTRPARPELTAAARGEVGVDTRYSATLGTGMLYVAVPLESGGKVTGLIRTALATDDIDRELRGVYVEIGAGIGAVALLTALASLWVSRRISRPLEELSRGAQLFARGELESRLGVPDIYEIGGMAESMNRMAALLDERIKTITRQRNEQDAILSSMVEGVLAVDGTGRVVGMNRSCAELLGIPPEAGRGRMIEEVVRNPDLQEFVRRTLSSAGAVEDDLDLLGGTERQLQAHGTALRDMGGREIGAVVVLNDVTRLRRLETVRRDFVANVSHELRTPITPIKAAVETLQDTGFGDPERCRQFLDIISRQADRLGAIIDDLLNLSRIEADEEAGIELQPGALEPVLRAAAQSCTVKAGERGIRIAVACTPGLTARINPPLIESAIVNLLDNAIKYSPDGATVRVEGVGDNSMATVRVYDSGCGIERHHLPRIFERFYRVDKARSRKLGGTGLGLAIVKHIAKAHGGLVSVESTPGRGSTFSLQLPTR